MSPAPTSAVAAVSSDAAASRFFLRPCAPMRQEALTSDSRRRGLPILLMAARRLGKKHQPGTIGCKRASCDGSQVLRGEQCL